MNLDRVEAILKLLQGQEHVGTLSVSGEGWSLRARRGAYPAAPPLDESPEAVETASAEQRYVVRAQAVGIYRAPDAAAQTGDFVSEGKALGNIDSMRILNPVAAEQGGYLAEMLVEDGDPVEYGQSLFVLTPELPAAGGEA